MSKAIKPRFSVIIPTYNRAGTIARAVKSVIGQEFTDWEMVIVDDGSQDETGKVVKPFLKDPRVRYFAQRNAGVSAARNFGVAQSSGEIVVFFDSDDEVKPRWLSDFEALLVTEPSSGYLSCGFILEDEEYLPRAGRGFSDQPYLCAPAGTFAMPKTVFEGAGGYDPNLRQSENWELAARVLTFCREQNLEVVHTTNCNIIWHCEKNQTQLKQRDLDRAKAYLHLHQKYHGGGPLQFRSHRFVLGAAVNFLRAGQISESRKWFYRSFRLYPSWKGLARLVCFEIPFLRRRVWMNRKFLIEITEG